MNTWNKNLIKFYEAYDKLQKLGPFDMLAIANTLIDIAIYELNMNMEDVMRIREVCRKDFEAQGNNIETCTKDFRSRNWMEEIEKIQNSEIGENQDEIY